MRAAAFQYSRGGSSLVGFIVFLAVATISFIIFLVLGLSVSFNNFERSKDRRYKKYFLISMFIFLISLIGCTGNMPDEVEQKIRRQLSENAPNTSPAASTAVPLLHTKNGSAGTDPTNNPMSTEAPTEVTGNENDNGTNDDDNDDNDDPKKKIKPTAKPSATKKPAVKPSVTNKPDSKSTKKLIPDANQGTTRKPIATKKP
jgi:hypothetical protein